MSSLFIEKNLVNGQWIDAQDRAVIKVVNPANNEVIGTVPDVSVTDVHGTIQAAYQAQALWAGLTAYARAEILLRWAQLIDENQQEIATIMTRENGKPFAEALAEVNASNITWYAEESKRAYGRVIPSNQLNRQLQVLKYPVGVSGLITPWNFPCAMVTRKAGAALAAGCAVILKPDHRTPFTALALAELAQRAGMPAGVLNVITGDAPMIGEIFCTHPHVRKISFTGSTAVGKILLQQSAPYLKKISLELGGNAPFIIFDSVTADEAVKCLLSAKIRNTGQACISPNRVYVHDKIYDHFVDKLTSALQQIKIGNGLDKDNQLGPLIDQKAVEKVDRLVQEAIADGARCLLGGKPHALGGNFYEMTLLVDVQPAMRISCDEIFGPVIAIQRFDSEEQVIAAANDSNYGLISYIMTQDISQSYRVSAALESGMVGVNLGVTSFAGAPFGGVKYSGMGREGGIEGLDAFLETKYIAVQY